LTRKRGTGATPEVAETKGKRFVSFQEPEREDKIQVGFMKELTGGDKINTRKLYKSPIEFRPQFKTILCCNDLPEIPSNDGGTWRRIRVVDFPSKFVDDPKESNEFKKDTEIPEKLKNWAPYFISLLIEMYAKFVKEGLKEPESVIKYTKDYQRRSDVYLDYIEENILETNDDSDILMFSALYNHFKQWHMEYYNEKPSKVLFKEYMERKYGKCIKRPERWKKLKFQVFEDEETTEDSDL
jgi:P4 family phage/plasmid primase-like protien